MTEPRRGALLPMPTRRGLSREAAAEYVGVSPGTFDRMIVDGQMPQAKRIYTRRIWDVRQLDAAMDRLGDEPEASGGEWDEVLG